MQPILILGFQRSGTTLLRRLVSMYPALKYDLLHEQWKLRVFQTPDEAFDKYKMSVKQAGVDLGSIASIEAGEKIAYYKDTNKVVLYVNQWLSWWPQAKVFHIVRSKQAVMRSSERTFRQDKREVSLVYNESVGVLSKYLSTFSNVTTIPYEFLVDRPLSMMQSIYSLLGEVPSEEYITKVITTKDPWEHEGRIMCGLRYKSRVG